jgi:hypothetical protein
LARLKRSFEKEKRLNNIHWQLADWQILMYAYYEAVVSNEDGSASWFIE